MSQDIVLAIHGLGARAEWLRPIGDLFEKDGYKFIAKDLPAFGFNHQAADSQSPYKRGHIDSYQEWLDFVDNQVIEVKEKHPDSRLILLGHSLGGLLVTNSNRANHADLLVLSVPGYAAGKNFNPVFVITTIFNYAFFKLIFGIDKLVMMPSSKKNYPSIFATDVHATGYVSPNLLIQIKKLQKKTKEKVKDIKVPILMIQAVEDIVVSKEEQLVNYMSFPNPQKKLLKVSGVDHDWPGNPDAPKVYEEMQKEIKSFLG